MYELWFEILRDFRNYRDYMGLSLMVRLKKGSLFGLTSYNLGGSVTSPMAIEESVKIVAEEVYMCRWDRSR